jgi:hypothetical protein
MNDKVFKQILYVVLVGLPIMLILWVYGLYALGCGGDPSCSGVAQPPVRTPIPTLIPASMPVAEIRSNEPFQMKCTVTALTLMGAWAEAGIPENDPFTFTDMNGTLCTATFSADIKPLFREANLWYPGASSCIGCHNADISAASANLNLTTYEGMLAGSRRTDENSKGNDILGGGVWRNSLLFEQLSTGKMPFGRPENLPPVGDGPIVFAGMPKPAE